MNTCENVFSSESYLMQEVANRLRGCFDSSEIDMLLFDASGNLQAGNTEILGGLGANQQLFKNICSRIDDGDEPIVSQIDGVGIVASGISGRNASLGYVFILLPGYSPERTIGSLDFLEIIISQVSMNVETIEASLNSSGSAGVYNADYSAMAIN